MTFRRDRFDPRIFAFAPLFFAAIAPTLSWPQFSGDSEDLLVQTTLEMRHGGPWWVPTLGGVPRLKKMPLPAWVTAASVSPATVRELASPDPSARDAAYRWLAWEVRWPALLAGAVMLLFVGWTARLIGGPAHALPAVMICGSSLLLTRFTRSATTDIHLALWVNATNACLATALFGGRRSAGLAWAGVAAGLGVMCKGPVVLLQSAVPFVLFVLLRGRKGTGAAV